MKTLTLKERNKVHNDILNYLLENGYKHSPIMEKVYGDFSINKFLTKLTNEGKIELTIQREITTAISIVGYNMPYEGGSKKRNFVCWDVSNVIDDLKKYLEDLENEF